MLKKLAAFVRWNTYHFEIVLVGLGLTNKVTNYKILRELDRRENDVEGSQLSEWNACVRH